MDVFKSLWTFSQKRRKKKDYQEKIPLEDFLEYFNENEDFDTPYESGVRIQSFPLAIQVSIPGF